MGGFVLPGGLRDPHLAKMHIFYRKTVQRTSVPVETAKAVSVHKVSPHIPNLKVRVLRAFYNHLNAAIRLAYAVGTVLKRLTNNT
jgi:hypothetical protein